MRDVITEKIEAHQATLAEARKQLQAVTAKKAELEALIMRLQGAQQALAELLVEPESDTPAEA